jgi:hypothetical protein
MPGSSSLRRRLAAAALLAASLAAGSGLHHHEDLAGSLLEVSGKPLDRVRSDHNPLAHGAHWHAGVSVKEDPCLACAVHRLPGLLAAEALATVVHAGHAATPSPRVPTSSVASLSNGSRAPPART